MNRNYFKNQGERDIMLVSNMLQTLLGIKTLGTFILIGWLNLLFNQRFQSFTEERFLIIIILDVYVNLATIVLSL